MAKISRLCAPSPSPYAMWVTPSIPKPQLFIKKIRSSEACFKKGFKASAPKGLTALLDKSILMIDFPIKPVPRSYKSFSCIF